MTNNARILHALRPYDPAPATMYNDVAATRAQARLEQILATAPERIGEQINIPRHRTSRRGIALRWAAVPTVAAAGLVVSLALPGATPSAFAGWTAVANPLTGAGLTNAATACQEQRDSLVSGSAALAGFTGPSTVTGAEQRGDVTLVVFSGPDSEALICLATAQGDVLAMTFAAPNTPAGRSGGWTAGGDGAQVSGFASGGLTDPIDAPQGVGHEVGISGTVGTNVFTAVSGEVAANVTGVTLHANRLSIEAMLGDGRYVAWWPGKADLYADVTYTITYADGTVRENVRPVER
jgi:hypothetical protein